MKAILSNEARTPRVSEMGYIMLNAEAAEGRDPIWPSTAPAWVCAEDWHSWPVLSIANGELHIIAVWAARKRALTDLITNARANGLAPVIVAPVGQTMPAILAKWGWVQSFVGEGMDVREEWRPQS